MYTDFVEMPMSTPMRKPRAADTSSNGDRRFPPEAYCYDDDVTPEAVEEVRQRAAKAVDADDWEVVDGFGLSV